MLIIKKRKRYGYILKIWTLKYNEKLTYIISTDNNSILSFVCRIISIREY